jgi:hypothetical protein
VEIVVGGGPREASEDQGIAGSRVIEEKRHCHPIGLAGGLGADNIIAMIHLAYDTEREKREAQQRQQNPR